MKIDKYLLDKVSTNAAESPRLRMNFNFHEGPDSKVQRLLNALEPGTIIPIHRHKHTAETYILLNPLNGEYGVHIPKGQWHSVEVLESGTVIFEVKDGPYTPLQPEDIME